MQEYAIRYIKDRKNFEKTIKAENIDNLRKRLIAEYHRTHSYVDEITVLKFKKGRGYVAIGMLDLIIYPMWSNYDYKTGKKAVPQLVYRNTGKIKR